MLPQRALHLGREEGREEFRIRSLLTNLNCGMVAAAPASPPPHSPYDAQSALRVEAPAGPLDPRPMMHMPPPLVHPDAPTLAASTPLLPGDTPPKAPPPMASVGAISPGKSRLHCSPGGPSTSPGAPPGSGGRVGTGSGINIRIVSGSQVRGAPGSGFQVKPAGSPGAQRQLQLGEAPMDVDQPPAAPEQ